jgi:hypothetical protein
MSTRETYSLPSNFQMTTYRPLYAAIAEPCGTCREGNRREFKVIGIPRVVEHLFNLHGSDADCFIGITLLHVKQYLLKTAIAVTIYTGRSLELQMI